MKKIVRLTENDLTRIVKKVIKEQGQTTQQNPAPQQKPQQPSPSNTNKTVEVVIPAGGINLKFPKDGSLVAGQTPVTGTIINTNPIKVKGVIS